MRPLFGRPPAILPRSHSAAPSPAMLKREKPGRSSTPTASRTASHSSRMRASHGPARFQVWVASSEVSSPDCENQLARSQPP